MKENTKIGIETERKYIIKMPHVSVIETLPQYTKSQILQIYLDSPEGETRRIRRRVFSDYTEYTETTKMRINKMSSHEIESVISAQRFYELSECIREGSAPIEKVRHTFSYQGNTIEIDIYPAWKHSAIMETELANPDDNIALPPFIEIIREVTGNREYSNAAMSRCFPSESL